MERGEQNADLTPRGSSRTGIRTGFKTGSSTININITSADPLSISIPVFAHNCKTRDTGRRVRRGNEQMTRGLQLETTVEWS